MLQACYLCLRTAGAWAVLVVSASVPAMAGDLAQRQIIGFSADGRHFAFEEYGRQDGSGFPYANIYVIETTENKWVKGSPYRVLVKKGGRPVTAARNKARAQFRAMRRKLGIFRKGRHLASNPATELSANPHRVEVSLRSPIMSGNPDAGNPLIFSIREFDLPSEDCRKYTQRQTRGFIWRVRRPGEEPRELHRDARIPKSRGCPFNYAISDVAALRKPDGNIVYVVITSVFRLGFEGPERRFVAGAYHDDGRRTPSAYRGAYEDRDILDAESYRDPDQDRRRPPRGPVDPFDR